MTNKQFCGFGKCQLRTELHSLFSQEILHGASSMSRQKHRSLLKQILYFTKNIVALPHKIHLGSLFLMGSYYSIDPLFLTKIKHFLCSFDIHM